MDDRTKDQRYEDGDCTSCGDPLDDYSQRRGYELCHDCKATGAREGARLKEARMSWALTRVALRHDSQAHTATLGFEV